MKNNSDVTRNPQTPFYSSYVLVHLTNVVLGNGSLKRTIYSYI